MQNDAKLFVGIILIVCLGLAIWKLGKAFLFARMDLVDLGILTAAFGGGGFALAFLLAG